MTAAAAGPLLLHWGVLSFIRKHSWWFLAITVAAALLRLFWVLHLSTIEGDSLVYGDMAKCLVTEHFLGITKTGNCTPTMIRMPGYSMYLALTFQFFGVDRYSGAMLFQILADVLTCFLAANLARRIFGERAARAAFLLMALCPFLVNYVATPLTECLETLCTVAALNCAVLALELRARKWWALCGASIAAAIYLRPDGGLLLGAFGLVLLWLMWRQRERWRELLAGAVLMGVVALLPLAPWTLRNYRVFHLFQPLVDPHAVDPGEYVPHGYEHWMSTWAFDYSASMDFGFPVSGGPVDVDNLPTFAYANERQHAELIDLFAQYNQGYDVTPALDSRFEALAQENIRLHPIRYHILLPVARALDMWFRPRNEMTQIDVHFWRIYTDPNDAWTSIAMGVLNIAYIALAVAGAWVLRKRGLWLGLLLAYPVVRTIFLGHIGSLEDRYTIECYPVVLVLAAGFIAWWPTRKQPAAQ